MNKKCIYHSCITMTKRLQFDIFAEANLNFGISSKIIEHHGKYCLVSDIISRMNSCVCILTKIWNINVLLRAKLYQK